MAETGVVTTEGCGHVTIFWLCYKQEERHFKHFLLRPRKDECTFPPGAVVNVNKFITVQDREK